MIVIIGLSVCREIKCSGSYLSINLIITAMHPRPPTTKPSTTPSMHSIFLHHLRTMKNTLDVATSPDLQALILNKNNINII